VRVCVCWWYLGCAGKDISPNEDLTLQQLIEGDIMQHWAAVEEVCTVAEKQHALDKALDNMMNEWKVGCTAL
jgi:hypothetical protein